MCFQLLPWQRSMVGLQRRAEPAPESPPLARRLSLSLDLAIPPFGPLFALVVDDRPVGRIELRRPLADRSHLGELRWDHDRLQHRAVAIILQEYELQFRFEQSLDEARCKR